MQLLVGHLGLGEQHVHVAGHPAGDRVDRVVDLGAARDQQVDQLAQRVLGLGDREAVAGHDDHPVGVAEHDRDVLGAGRLHRPVGGLAAAERRAALERAEQDVGHRAAHGLGHQQGEERAGRADERAGHQQQRVGQHVAARGDGQAGERVEQRDDDRHVGAADRQHQEYADQQAEQRDARCPATSRARATSSTESTTAAMKPPPKRTGKPGMITGREVISSCSLAKVTIEPANETEPTRIVNAVATRVNFSTSTGVGARRSRAARAARPARPRRRRRR